MQTISETPNPRNPRSVPTRRAHQCARPGWRGRRRTPQQQAELIADAIRRHRADGHSRWTQPSEYTPHAETQALVWQLLSVEQ
jgi:hypothetical protein